MKEEHYFLKRDLHCFSWPTFLLLKHFFFSCLGSEVSQNCVEGNNQYHIIQLSIIIGLNKTHPQIKYFSKVKVLTFLTHANHQQLNAEMTAKTSNQVKWRCKAIDEEQRCVKYWQMLVWCIWDSIKYFAMFSHKLKFLSEEFTVNQGPMLLSAASSLVSQTKWCCYRQVLKKNLPKKNTRNLNESNFIQIIQPD